jgi:branched-chain amino acid transport system ATP-binding protein
VAREGVGRVWQGIRLFPTMKTVENIAIAASNGISENPVRSFFPNTYQIDKENKKNAVKWLSMLGLGDRLDSSCDKISLGQMKRVAIARSIQAGAKILFLDEPLSGLDEKGVAEVVQYLQMLVKQHSITLVIVEHSLNIPKVIDLVDTVWRLSKENHSQRGYKLLIEDPRSMDMAEKKGYTALDELLKEIVGYNCSATSVDLPGGAKLTTIDASLNDTSILEIKNLTIKRGIRTIFSNETSSSKNDQDGGLSLTLKKGQLMLLEAPNGWGKSTLLDAIAGLRNGSLKITAGEVLFKGKDITSLPTHRIVKMGLSYLRANQQPFITLKIKEQLKLCQSNHVVFGEFLDKTRSSKGGSLSGGEKQKLLINMLPDADLYLLDEPMSGLDQNSINSFSCVLKDIANMGKTLIITIPCASKEN